MGMSRCYSLMKCLLIIFNIIFLSVGVGVCAFAGWALWDGRGSETGEGRAGLCALAAWAAVLTVAALAAITGAIRGSASLLAAAFALLALSALAEAAAAWWGAAHLPALRDALAARLRRTVTHEYGVVASRSALLDAIQHGLQCCGADGVRDWQRAAWHPPASPDASPASHASPASPDLDLSVGAPAAYYWVPTSCCATQDAAECEAARRVPAASGGAAGLHAAPCAAAVQAALWGVARAPLGAAAALLAAHAAALLLALALCLRAHPPPRYKA